MTTKNTQELEDKVSDRTAAFGNGESSMTRFLVPGAEDRATEGLQRAKPICRGNTNPLSREEKKHIRAEIVRWTFTPEPYRNPPTLKQLAQDLHISYSYAKYVKAKIPKTLPEYLSECEMAAVSQYGSVCETLAEKAKAGDKDAAKLIATEMVKPLKSVRTEQPRTQTPESVTRAFLMLGVVKEQMQLEREAAENQAHIEEKEVTPTLAAASLSECKSVVSSSPHLDAEPSAPPAEALRPDPSEVIRRPVKQPGPAYERRIYDDIPTRLN